jgi:hypothetical protein
MSTFDKREQVFEGKFAHDEELLFKVLARANKLIGLWAAEKLGKSGALAEEYANSLVAKEVASHSEAGVLAQIFKDLSAGGVAQSEHQIARHFEELRVQAAQEVTQK